MSSLKRQRRTRRENLIANVRHWIVTHGYTENGLRLYRCQDANVSITHRGMLTYKGGKRIVEPWAKLHYNTIQKLHRSAKRAFFEDRHKRMKELGNKKYHIETNCFISFKKAWRYYRALEGRTTGIARLVRSKEADGSISFTPPELLPGQRLALTHNKTKYSIEDYHA